MTQRTSQQNKDNMIKTTLKIREIKNNPNNPRLIKDDKFKKLVKSIQEFPEMLDAREVVVNKDHIILGGNMRFKAAKEAGIKEVPVKIVDWDEDKQRQFVIKDNVSGGEWDWDQLANEWEAEELDEWGLDVPADWGEEKEIEEDEAPEVDESEPPKSKLGEIYQLGQHRVMCADSTVKENVEKLMNGEKADMVFTDPPYRLKIGKNGAFKKAHDKLTKDLEKIIDYNPNDLFSVLPSVFDNQTMNAFVFCNTDLVPDYCLWARECKYNFNILTWHKTSFIPAGGNHHYPDTEYLIYISKQPIFNAGLSVNYGKYWVLNNEKSEDHPTIKPQKIITDELIIGSNKGSIVVDFYIGSGSTLIACEQTDRTCFGMELDPKYVDVIRKRYHKFVTGSDEGWEDGTPAVV